MSFCLFYCVLSLPIFGEIKIYVTMSIFAETNAKSRSRMKVSDVYGGIWFQIFGPQTEKARFPNWVRVRTTKAFEI